MRRLAGAAAAALAAVLILAVYTRAWSAFAVTAEQSLMRLFTS